MSNALRNRLSDAKTAADKSVKDKSTRGPLSEITPDLQLVPTTDDVLAPPTSIAPTAGEDMIPAVPDAVPPAGPVIVQPVPAAVPARVATVASRTSAAVVVDVVGELSAPPAAMGMAQESRLLAVPMTEDAYRLLQQLDRELVLSRRRPVNRVRLLTVALEQVLQSPQVFHDRYLAEYQAGASWKRRVQARIPVGLADQLPALRYTGESRQSAGMLVSIAVTELLEAAKKQIAAEPA